MSFGIVTPPATDPVTLEDAKAFLRVDHADDDAMILRSIQAVTSWLAGPDGWLGRSLCDQTLEVTVDEPCGPIILPRPPFLEVVSVVCPDADGFDVVIPAGLRRTVTGVDGLARVEMRLGQSWPSMPGGECSVRVRYRAGYGTSADPARPIDPAIQHAILMTVSQLYGRRGDGEGGALADPSARDLFAPFRVWTPER